MANSVKTGVNPANQPVNIEQVKLSSLFEEAKDGCQLNYKQLAKHFYSAALWQKKISMQMPIEDINRLFDYITYFNSLKSTDMRALDVNFEDINIINELVPFIIPNSVRYDGGNYLFKDLLVRTSYNWVEDNMSLEEFMILQTKFRNLFKKDAQSEITTLKSIKADKSYEEVRNIAYDGEFCEMTDGAFMPLCLMKGCLKYFRISNYDRNDVELVLKTYFSNLTF